MLLEAPMLLDGQAEVALLGVLGDAQSKAKPTRLVSGL